jgi:hypothetical protein
VNSTRLRNHKPRAIASEWLQGCKNEEDKKKEIEYLQNCSTLFDKIREMIQRRYDSALNSKDTDYDSASWAHKQAHLNGRLEALEELYKLLP